MRALLIVTVAIIATQFAGCATSKGVVEIGPDTYIIAREAATGFAGTANIRFDAIREANEFCKNSGRKFVVVSTHETPGRPFVYPRAEINFMCLKDGDPALTRPVLTPVPTTASENGAPQPVLIQAPVSQPMKIYHPPRPAQTSCTSRMGAGGAVQSDCTSRPSGVDTSIYDR